MLATVEGAKPKPRNEALYIDSKTDVQALLAAAGDYDGGVLDFTARTILVDNYSAVYVYLPTVKRYASPATRDQSFPANNVRHKQVRFLAPPGVVQPADDGKAIIVTWLSESYARNPETGR